MSEKGGGSTFDGPYRVNEDNQPICSRRKQSCRNCGHHFIGRQHSDSEYDLWECPECSEPRWCRNVVPAHPTGCRFHGKHALKGAESPTFRHGRMSRYFKPSLADDYEDFLLDPNRLALEEEMALTRTLMWDRIREMEKMDVVAAWAQANKLWHDANAAKRKKLTGRGGVGKTIVHGMLQRTTEDQPSQVRVKVVPNQKRSTLWAEIRRSVKKGETVYTDKLASYEGLDAEYIHQMIDHAVEYVRGNVHTNGMENFWSLLKRCFKGTYIHVAPWHLFRYLDEEAFRFNKRKVDDGSRFEKVMRAVVGQRLQYKELTALRPEILRHPEC